MPKSDAALVGKQNFHRQSPAFWPYLGAKNPHRSPANPPTPAISNNEKVPQVNLLRPLPVKSIGDNRSAVLKNHRLILGGEPASQPLLKLRRRHRVPMSLVLNQLVIQFGKHRAIIQRCGSECHSTLPLVDEQLGAIRVKDTRIS